MGFEHNQLPNPTDYYRGFGLRLDGQGKWRTTCCNFCDFRSMRVNVKSGAFQCAECGASGIDVLHHYTEMTGANEEQAAKALGAWQYNVDAPSRLGGRYGI